MTGRLTIALHATQAAAFRHSKRYNHLPARALERAGVGRLRETSVETRPFGWLPINIDAAGAAWAIRTLPHFEEAVAKVLAAFARSAIQNLDNENLVRSFGGQSLAA